MRLIIAIIVLISGFAEAASAETPASSPSPETVAIARQVVITMRLKQTFEVALPLLLKNMRAAVTHGDPEIEKKFDKFSPAFVELGIRRLDEFQESVALAYARHLTAEQLRDLLAFYQSPSGQGLLAEQPALMKETAAIGGEWGRRLGGEVDQQMKEK